jgi:hypothetical protein
VTDPDKISTVHLGQFTHEHAEAIAAESSPTINGANRRPPLRPDTSATERSVAAVPRSSDI